MNISVSNYIDIIDNETITIGHLLSGSFRSAHIITTHCVSIYFESRQMLKEIKLEAKTSSAIIDGDLKLVERLEALQNKIKSTYHNMGKELLLGRYFLKKAFNNFGLIIVTINEHDVDVDNTPSSGPFDSVDDLMNYLNS